MTNTDIKKKIFKLLPIIFSVAVFILVFKSVVDSRTLDLFQLLSLKLFIVILITGLLQLSINCVNQKVLMQMYNFQISFLDLFLHNSISSMYVLVIPGVFAPDFYLGYHYGKEKKDYGRVISALFISRIIGFITFFLLAVMASIYLGTDLLEKISFKVDTNSISSYIGFILLVVALLTILTVLLYRLFKSRIQQKLIKLKIIWAETKGKHKELFFSFLLRLTFMIVGVTGRVSLGILLGVHLPFFHFASIVLILNLLISLPISFNGIGVREAGYVGLLTLFGISKELSFLFALSEFGITLLGGILGLLGFTINFFLLNNKKKTI